MLDAEGRNFYKKSRATNRFTTWRETTMAIAFTISKIKASSSRKLPLLPRLGVVIDVAGLQLAFRHVPLIETLVAARAKGGISLSNLRIVATEALEEVRLPASLGRGLAVVRSFGAKAKAKAVKKTAAKAAARRAGATKSEEQPTV